MNMFQVYLDGADHYDPLRDVLNCSMKLNDKKVIGVILENECVIYNGDGGGSNSSSDC